jgi:tRNA threonylcarbamoyladenosine biosynthesis protein TsaB
LSIGDVQAIGFGRGPGAFTGLRSACAAAQGLAFGIDRPVVPVDSLLLVAEAARRRRFADAAQAHVGVVMDARMAELYAARYAWRDGLWTALQPPGLWSADALEASWRGSDQPDWWAGSGLGLVQPKGERGEPADDGDERARALLRLTVQGLLAGQAVPAREALPLYLRDKVALTTAERAAAASLRDAA